MTDSHADIGAPRYRPPRYAWMVKCLDCQATGIYYREAEAHQWVEEHEAKAHATPNREEPPHAR